MKFKEKQAYLKEISGRYLLAKRIDKKNILDEFCKVCGHHRKHAVRLLNQVKPISKPLHKMAGRKKIYRGKILTDVVKDIWLSSNQPCAKRLKPIINIWLPFYEKHNEKIEKEVSDKLNDISPASLERVLKEIRPRYPKRFCGTKPGSLLKTQIPIKVNQWDESKPGFVEADTVAHCGTSLLGEFIWSLTLTDIATGWTENRGVWGKGSAGVIAAIKDIKATLPFLLLGFDCDNGSEFLNHHLVRYFQEQSPVIQFTRSRPYHKNDNAHVEQKNWTHVREIFGYERFDTRALLPIMNEIYVMRSLLQNYFIPCIKLASKKRIGGKIKKTYGNPLTPYERCLESKHLPQENKNNLIKIMNGLDPFEIRENIKKKQKEFLYYFNNRFKKVI